METENNQKTKQTNKPSGCQGRGEGENQQSTEEFYVAVTRSSPTECTAPRVSPDVNCGLWEMWPVNVGASPATSAPFGGVLTVGRV